MSELTVDEKRFIALALHSVAVRQGPGVFDVVESIAHKLGVRDYLMEYAKSWIQFAQAEEQRKHMKDSRDAK